MTVYVNIPLSKRVYEQVQKLAELRQQRVEDVIASHLVDTLPLPEADTASTTTLDSDVQREKDAYLALHPQLKESHMGQYVAIFQEQLIDSDSDYGALFERIDDQYPDTFVWMTQVKEEPIDTLIFRSPRVTIANS